MQDQGLYLEHYGVLGMKWGRRRADKKAAYIDSRIERRASSRDTRRVQRAVDLTTKIRDKHLSKGQSEAARKTQMDVDRYQKKLDVMKDRDQSRISKLAAEKDRVLAQQAAAERAFEVLGKKNFNRVGRAAGKGGVIRVSEMMTQGKKTFGEAFFNEMARQSIFGSLSDSRFADRTMGAISSSSKAAKTKATSILKKIGNKRLMSSIRINERDAQELEKYGLKDEAAGLRANNAALARKLAK